jgi:PHD/YefM family antitoxin component YafN of YafNO toxin-antitoxin module
MLIPTLQNTKTISDLRERPVELLKAIGSSYDPLYIFYRSKPNAVMISLAAYQKLLDLAEDYLDSSKAEEYEKEDKRKIGWIKHQDLLAKFK